MDTLKAIEKLAQLARNEKTHVFDVSSQVLMRITETEPIRVVPLSVFAGLSAVAASIALFAAVKYWIYMSNPIMELFTPLQEVALW
ncbi:MAG: hypothetical protein ACYST9_05810 [Planctomycetota bacterium]|jgi:hypothetical protein